MVSKKMQRQRQKERKAVETAERSAEAAERAETAVRQGNTESENEGELPPLISSSSENESGSKQREKSSSNNDDSENDQEPKNQIYEKMKRAQEKMTKTQLVEVLLGKTKDVEQRRRLRKKLAKILEDTEGSQHQKKKRRDDEDWDFEEGRESWPPRPSEYSWNTGDSWDKGEDPWQDEDPWQNSGKRQSEYSWTISTTIRPRIRMYNWQLP
jgi:hypothetical protein